LQHGTGQLYAEGFRHFNQPKEKTMKLAILTSLMIASALPAFAAETPKAESQGPNDAQIAHIVVTADMIDINAGKLAESKTKNPEVKKFAKQMVTDHTAVNKQASALAKKLGVTPEDNDTSKSLMKGADEHMAKLKKMKGSEFDKEYVDHEVAYHEAVLSAIDKTLIPSAKNAELKALIEKVRPAFEAHLQHAKHLQTELASGKKQ
jgi:putative membrane protein